MKQRTFDLLNLSLFPIVALSFTGCAFTPEKASIDYAPQYHATALEGADKVNVRLVLTDMRPVQKNKVGHKINGFQMETAQITSTVDIPSTITSAIETELVSRGFKIADGGAIVSTELTKFYNNWQVGFWSGTALAELTMNVKVNSADSALFAYASVISGEGKNPGCQLTSGKNAEIALNAALSDGIGKLMSDSAFISSLFKAATNNTIRTKKLFSSEAKVELDEVVLPPVSWDPIRLAIAELTSLSLQANEVQTLSETLRSVMDDTQYFAVISRKDMKDILNEHNTHQTVSSNDTQFLVELGKLLSAEKIIGGDIGKVGATYSLTLRLIDVETGRINETVTIDIKDSPDALLKVVRVAGKQLAAKYARSIK